MFKIIFKIVSSSLTEGLPEGMMQVMGALLYSDSLDEQSQAARRLL